MTGTHEVDDCLHRLHRAARRLPADERDAVIGLARTPSRSVPEAWTRNRPGRRSSGSVTLRAIVAEALEEAQVERFRPGLAIWTLDAAWGGCACRARPGPGAGQHGAVCSLAQR